jgi:hypothetical protein
MTLLFSLLLTGCVSADAGVRRADASVAAPVDHGLTLDELMFADVRGAARATEIVRDDLRALSPEARAEVAASMEVLVRNCPFTRASVQLPRALHRVVMETPLGEIDGGYAQSDWLSLRRGLTAHVEALDAMGAHLPLPETGDYLYEAGDGWLLDDAALARADDPVAATLPLLHRVRPLVEGYDRATADRIDLHRRRIEGHTMHGWVLSEHVWAWRDALVRMAPFVAEPEAKARVQAMLEALEALGREGC